MLLPDLVPNRTDYQKQNYPVKWVERVQEPWAGRLLNDEGFTVECSSFNVFLPIDFGNQKRADECSGKHPTHSVVLPRSPPGSGLQTPRF